MAPAPAEAIAAGVVGAVVLLLLLRSWLARRALLRRLTTVSTKLEPTLARSGERRGVERALARLERAADDGGLRVDAAVETAARVRGGLERVPDAVIIWDADGEEVVANATADALRKDPLLRVLLEDALVELRGRALGGRRGERSLDLLGPPHRRLVLTVDPLEDAARTSGAVAVIHDAGAERRFDDVRADLVVGAGRRLAEPAAAMVALAGTAVAAADLGDVATVKTLVVQLARTADRLRSTVADLGLLAVVEGGATPVRRPVGVAELVAAAVAEQGAAARAHRVEVVVDVALDMQVLGDRDLLVAVVGHLLANAIGWAPAGSTVCVTATEAVAVVAVSVHDEGPGLRPVEAVRAFDRFYRGRDAPEGGAGLGLAVVRQVAEAHGGAASVASAEGDGATFTVSLPLLPAGTAAGDGAEGGLKRAQAPTGTG